MNSYTGVTAVYDKLMREDIDYDKWTDYIEEIFAHFEKKPKLICDLACGTGTFTVNLAKRGYDMIGVDKSQQMLNKAREKALAAEQDILFLAQSFTGLDLYGGCDAFLCMLDGFNYVLSPKTLFEVAKKIKTCFLEPGGIFIFDLSSIYKLEHYIGNNTFIYDKDGIFYAWENKFHKKIGVSDMYMNFFVKSGGGGYKRFSERHLQKAYTEQEIKKIFSAAGFCSVESFSPLSFSPPKKTDMRNVFVAW